MQPKETGERENLTSSDVARQPGTTREHPLREEIGHNDKMPAERRQLSPHMPGASRGSGEGQTQPHWRKRRANVWIRMRPLHRPKITKKHGSPGHPQKTLEVGRGNPREKRVETRQRLHTGHEVCDSDRRARDDQGSQVGGPDTNHTKRQAHHEPASAVF